MARTVFVQMLISYFRESWVGGAYWATDKPPDKLVKPGFHMSGKFYPIRDFAVSQPSQILSGRNRENRKHFSDSPPTILDYCGCL